MDGPAPTLTPRRRLGTGIAAYGSGAAILALAPILLVPVYARALGPSGYGAVEILLAIVGLGQAVLTLGSDSALAILVHRSPQEMALGVIRSALTIAVVGGAAGALVGLVVAFGVASATDLDLPAVVAAIAAMLAAGVLAVALSALRNLGLPLQFLQAALLSAATTVVVGLLTVVGLGLGEIGPILAVGAGSVAGLVTIALRTSIVTAVAPRVPVGPLLRLGSPLIPGALALWLVGYGDRFIMAALGPIAEVGLYAAAWKVATVAGLLVNAFLLAWSPFGLSQSQRPEAPRVFATAFSAFAVVSAAGTMAAAVLAPLVIPIVAGSAYRSAIPLLWLLVGGVFLYGSASMQGIVLQGELRTGALSMGLLAAAAIKIALSFALIPTLGALGAAAATFSGYSAMCALLLLLGSRVRPIPYPIGVLTLLWVGTGATCAALIYLGPPAGVQAAVSVAFIGVVLWLGRRPLTGTIHLLRNAPLFGDA